MVWITRGDNSKLLLTCSLWSDGNTRETLTRNICEGFYP